MEINHTSEYIEKKQHGDIMLPFVIYGTIMPFLYDSYPLHCHEEMEIVFVDSGTCRYTIANEEVDLIEGDILVMMPWALHSFRLVHHDDFFLSNALLASLSMINHSAVDICSSKYFSPILNCGCSSYCLIRCTSKHYTEFREIINELCETYFLKEPFFEIKLKHLLNLLFYSLLKYKYIEIYSDAPTKSDAESVRCVIDYISENYKNHITLDRLAELVHLSETRLSRIFRSITGMSCIDYVIEYRLSKALDMLRSSDMSVIEIAYETGFNNISYFNRTFKKHFNKTPTEYRKKIGSNASDN